MAASLWLLFVSAFTSATLLPGSSEAVLIGLLAADGGAWAREGPVLLIVVATLGNCLGSVVNWALGRFFSRYRDRKWFPVNEDEFARAEAWYRRWGIWSLTLSWMPLIGDPITLVAGVLRTNFLPFIAIVVFAKAARYAFIAWGVVAVVA
ncbi:YqaA family protein [Pelagibius sp. Alg239-R121]|uniref:YqaA family protein n=1 Tax=Pelagibius sp. Alg239-R121 TaxID=2993448 RepID=UPI0024A777A6|nr:YqaA family protein [Pelagibius sp. Alg239-R121]